VRTFTLEVLVLIEQRMRVVARHTAAAFGVHCDFAFKRNYPPTINHVREARFVRGVMQELVGEAATRDFEPTMGAEDFSFMLQDKPGAYFMIGNGVAGDTPADDAAMHGLGGCSLHNPRYDFNDAVLPLGASLWVRIAQRWLAQPAG
jgi:hippurate hydrolase